MKRDRVFAPTAVRSSDFVFDEEVASVFDDMLVRSVPLYEEQQHMVREIAQKFWIASTDVYDLGCSTAPTLLAVCRAISGPAPFIGYDNSPPMLERARRNVRDSGFERQIELRAGDPNGDLANLELRNASVVTLCSSSARCGGTPSSVGSMTGWSTVASSSWLRKCSPTTRK
jgi:tRNA (cmo5U34)-methyltransferase